ncbi:MAG: hypothetical protein PHS93_00890 [Candidatus Omnitrophica bacterium]|nr:hypothetical protein [Candidatus Omnitrophota bacterium]MDD5351709.1 hypothetical protein [Candidatus Omnitrophota bacterium]MDD5550919.1 hypothetical protein [Candidatus Omnitrophota bacterium]
MKKRLIFALLLMGFTSLVAQVLLIREFLVCFYGNEFTIGLILSNWTILVAIGSGFFARFSQKNKMPLLSYGALQCLIAFCLPFCIYLIRILRNLLPLTAGEAVGIIPVFAASFFILIPLNVFIGAQFPLGCRIWKDHTQRPTESAGSVYIIEAIGFIIAGPVFTYLFITRLNSFQIAFIISLLNLFSAILLLQKTPRFFLKKVLIYFIGLVIGIVASATSSNLSGRLNSFSLRKQWKGYTLINSQNSIYGNISVTKEKEQYTFFSDGIPIITVPVPDIISTEEFIHFGMLSHADPRNILVIGGGAGGPIAEILKYPVTHIDYAELDPLLIKMVRRYSTALTEKEFNDSRLSIKITDGVKYIKTTTQRYDIVFINLPPPATFQLNRFYTKEFFALAQNVFEDTHSMLIFNLPGSLSYLSPELQKLNLSILNTLKSTFKFVKVIPGDANLYLACQSDFSIDAKTFTERLNKTGISTRLLTPFHIRERLDRQWQDWFYTTLAKSAGVKNNTSFLPIGLFYGLSYWDALFSPYLSGFFKVVEKVNLKILLLPVILLSVLFLLLSYLSSRLKRLSIPYAILTTGFLGLAYELIIIFTYQSFYGYVYHHIALLITAFMAGLTLGGWLLTKKIANIKNKKNNFILFESGLIIFSLAIVPIFIYLEKSKSNISYVFFIVSAISGFLVGAEFPLANSLYQIKNSTQTAGILYALDLAGSWLGALVVSIILIPVLGLAQTCIFLAAIKLSSLILISLLKN